MPDFQSQISLSPQSRISEIKNLSKKKKQAFRNHLQMIYKGFWKEKLKNGGGGGGQKLEYLKSMFLDCELFSSEEK